MIGDPSVMAQFRIAYALRKTRAEVLKMNMDEFNGWIAFFNIQSREKPRGS